MKCPFTESIEALRTEVKDLQEVFKEMKKIKDYWRREYIDECERQENWVKEHRIIVEKLLNIPPEEESIPLEDLLFKVYKQLERQRTEDDVVNRIIKLTDRLVNNNIQIEAVKSLAIYRHHPAVQQRLIELSDCKVTKFLRIAAIQALGGRSPNTD